MTWKERSPVDERVKAQVSLPEVLLEVAGLRPRPNRARRRRLPGPPTRASTTPGLRLPIATGSVLSS